MNDSLGHLIGDKLLIEITRRLETCLRGADVIARLGAFVASAERVEDPRPAPFHLAGIAF